MADRLDTKFLFSAADLVRILDELEADYQVMEVAGRRISSYRTRYFDTADFRLYGDHHGGRLPRQKVRIRSYLHTHTAFFEIKQKTGSGRTIKSRVALDGDFETPVLERLAEAVAIPLTVPPHDLRETLSVAYERITLLAPSRGERVTFDLLLEAERGTRRTSDAGVVVAELKQEGPGASSFRATMRSRNVRPVEMSKYCTSLARLEPVLKRNLFKPVLGRLEALSRPRSQAATSNMLES